MTMMRVSIVSLLLVASVVQARIGKSTNADDYDAIDRALLPLTEGLVAPYPLTVVLADSPEDSPDSYPLGLCNGNCKEDEDCEGALVCLERDEAEDPIPGCNVTEDAGNANFCVFPELDLIAFQPAQAEEGTYPLGLCEGDCDGNLQCGPGLICWQRNRGDPVPGCAGIDEYEESVTKRPTDFCVLEMYNNATVYDLYDITAPPTRAPPPPTPAPVRPVNQLQTVGNNGNPADKFPLALCKGDCDDDDECAGDLVCYESFRGQAISGCIGSSNGSDYCILPSDAAATGFISTQLQNVGDEGEPVDAFPLGVCQGDCDADEECGDGLKCFYCQEGDSVPGCTGISDGTDYCVPENLNEDGSSVVSKTGQETIFD